MDIGVVVESLDFQRLIGEVEGQHLDAKSQPYQFASGNDVKREFAKDVAAFANAGGGCIVIGAETDVPTLQPGEQIIALKPFPGTLFDPDQLGKILAEWLYPQPSGLIMKWYPYGSIPGNGIGIIFIPAQDPTTKPYLLTRSMGDKKTTETLLGYVERRLDRTEIKSVIELHHAMRTGMNLEGTLLGRIATLEALIERHLTAAQTAPPQPPTAQQTPPSVPPSAPAKSPLTIQRLGRALAQPQLQDTRNLVIAITPGQPTELRSIFSDQPTSVRRALENPSELRANGWGIRTGAPARFIDGEFIQTESYREVINLYRDGQLIVAARIDRDGLAWADKNDSRIHPLALIEFVMNTFNFYRLALQDMRVAPSTLELTIGLSDLTQNGETTSLPAGAINNLGWTIGSKPAPAGEWSRTIAIPAATYDPARAAFLLVRELYVWYGHSDESIPYTAGSNDDRMIDTAGIAGIR